MCRIWAFYNIDAYGLLTDAVSDPAKFGFSNVTDPCWTGGFTGYATGGTVCSTLPAVQDTYLFWDTVHPTAEGHLLVAEAGYALVHARAFDLGDDAPGPRRRRLHRRPPG
jgi:phospholipase/lecithinase/hemolysin